MKKRKRVLIISYIFPPEGGSGVQRILKWTKYLPEFGWDPIIIAPEPSKSLLQDNSFLSEIPNSAKIIRTTRIDHKKLGVADLNIGYSGKQKRNSFTKFLLNGAKKANNWVIIPDNRIGWYFPARKAIKNLLDEVDVVLTTSGPESVNFIGKYAKKHLKVPWVADFRDGWTDDPYKIYPTNLHYKLNQLLESSTLSNADSIIVATETIKGKMAEKQYSHNKNIKVITNGYDEIDFHGTKFSPVKGTYRVRYIGTLYAHHLDKWRVLIEALKDLSNSINEIIVLEIFGAFRPEFENMDYKGLDVKFHGYVMHSEVTQKMVDADLLIHIVNDPISWEGTLTGKIFEYIASGTPMLALIPEKGEAAKLINQSNSGMVVDTFNKELIISALKRLHSNSGARKGLNLNETKQFQRKSLTASLVDELNRLVVIKNEE